MTTRRNLMSKTKGSALAMDEMTHTKILSRLQTLRHSDCTLIYDSKEGFISTDPTDTSRLSST
jgi:hypothetical protein